MDMHITANMLSSQTCFSGIYTERPSGYDHRFITATGDRNQWQQTEYRYAWKFLSEHTLTAPSTSYAKHAKQKHTGWKIISTIFSDFFVYNHTVTCLIRVTWQADEVDRKWGIRRSTKLKPTRSPVVAETQKPVIFIVFCRKLKGENGQHFWKSLIGK